MFAYAHPSPAEIKISSLQNAFAVLTCFQMIISKNYFQRTSCTKCFQRISCVKYFQIISCTKCFQRISLIEYFQIINGKTAVKGRTERLSNAIIHIHAYRQSLSVRYQGCLIPYCRLHNVLKNVVYNKAYRLKGSVFFAGAPFRYTGSKGVAENATHSVFPTKKNSDMMNRSPKVSAVF